MRHAWRRWWPFMQRQRKPLRHVRRQRDFRSGDLDLFGLDQPDRRHSSATSASRSAPCQRESESSACARASALMRPSTARHSLRHCSRASAGQRFGRRRRIAGAVIDLARQQILSRFSFLALGEVDGDADHADAFRPRRRAPATLLSTQRNDPGLPFRRCGIRRRMCARRSGPSCSIGRDGRFLSRRNEIKARMSACLPHFRRSTPKIWCCPRPIYIRTVT